MSYLFRHAFCLVTYVCTNCQTKEIIFNSRDGQVSIFISCAKCGEVAGLDSHLSRYCPNFKPGPGMRVFVDTTKESFLKKNQKRIDDMLEKFPNFTLKEIQNSLLENFNEFVPDLIMIDKQQKY